MTAGRRRIGSGSEFETQIGFSRAVVDGSWVHVSGCTGVDYETMTFADGVVAQAEHAWQVRPIGPNPVGAYAAAAETAVTAFAADDILDRSLWLPEIRADEPFAAPVAIGFHLVDCVAHGWDVAAGIGVEAEFEPDLVAAALSIAEQVPTGAAREAPDAAFGPVLPVDAGRSELDRVLLLLGRSPSWPTSALT